MARESGGFWSDIWIRGLNVVYLGLAAVGWWRCRAQTAAGFLILFVATRTVAMTQLQTVEPRYVIECFPVIVALGALAWTMPWRGSGGADALKTRRDDSFAG